VDQPKSQGREARTIALAVVIGLFVLMQVVLAVVLRVDTLDMDVGPNNQPSPDFFGPTDIGQTFAAAGENIGRIDLLFGTHGRSGTYRIGFELYEAGPPEAIVATSEIEASGLRNNLFNTFRFPAVRGTRGRAFRIRLAAPAATASDAVALWTNGGDILPDGTFFYNGAPAAGDLVFRVYSRRTAVSELARVVGRNPGVLSSPILFVLVLLLLEASLIWTLVSIVDRVFERRD